MQLREINPLVGPIGIILGYFENTTSFFIALLVGFLFNIIAGFRADQVHFKMWRLCNFSGNKLKDSLMELLIIVIVTSLLKLLADLMHQADKSSLIVQGLIWVAIYYYVCNGLRNLVIAYPRIRWLRFVYIALTLQFAEMAPKSIKDAWQKSKSEGLPPEEKEPNQNKEEI